MKRASIVIAAIGLLSTSCLTVTVKPGGGVKEVSEPTVDQTEHFFLWGLIGEKHIDVKAACNSGKVKQLQTRQSFVNGLLSALTFGIYSPRSARIWCARTTQA